MADTPYPIPRTLRQTDVLLGNGGSSYGPFAFQVFDPNDIKAYVQLAGESRFSERAVTVTKVNGAALDFFTVTFSIPLPNTAKYVISGQRLGERSAGVNKGTMLSMDALEREISKLVTTEQELRRDVGRALLVDFGEPGLTVDPGIENGRMLVKNGDRLEAGPNGADIANAAENAEDAKAARDAAIAAALSVETIITLREIEVGNPGDGYDFDHPQDALNSIVMPIGGAAGQVLIKCMGHLKISTSGYAITQRNPYGSQIKFRGGIPPLQRNLIAMTDVTGVPGGYICKGLLDDASGIVAGDYLLLRDVVPGYRSIYTYTADPKKPRRGELWMPRSNLGKIYTVGTNAKVGGPEPLSAHMDPSALLLLKAQVRRASAFNPNETDLTLATGGLDFDIASSPRLNWWWYARQSGNGFLTVTGDQAVGSSTTLEAITNAGDYALVQNGGMGRIESIEDNTHMTFERPMTIAGSNHYWAPVIRGHHHEGIWRITNVDGNVVTWTNTSWSPYKPPKNGIIAGKATILKSSIEMTGSGHAFDVHTFLDIDDMAIVGDMGTGSTIGIRGDGVDKPTSPGVRLGANCGVLGFGHPVYMRGGSLSGPRAAYCGGRINGCYASQGTYQYQVDAVANGNKGKGFVSHYSGILSNFSGARSMGNEDDALWVPYGTALAESFLGEDCGRGAIWAVGGGSIAAVQAQLRGCLYGFRGENGSRGSRLSGALFCANQVAAVEVDFGDVEITDGNFLSEAIGVSASNGSRVKVIQSGFSYNGLNKSVDASSQIIESLVSYL